MATDKREQFKVSGEEIVKKIKELIKEGNVRRVKIKDENDKTLMEFTLTIGVIGTVLAPILAAAGALAALATNCTIEVERK
jgi:hypothetical protein